MCKIQCNWGNRTKKKAQKVEEEDEKITLNMDGYVLFKKYVLQSHRLEICAGDLTNKCYIL